MAFQKWHTQGVAPFTHGTGCVLVAGTAGRCWHDRRAGAGMHVLGWRRGLRPDPSHWCLFGAFFLVVFRLTAVT